MRKQIKLFAPSFLFSLLIAACLLISMPINAQESKKTDFEIHYSKAIKAQTDESFEKAASELESALDIVPDSNQANYALGIVYQQLNRHTDALKKFNVVYKKDKTFKFLPFRVGLSYFNLKAPDKAEKFFKFQISKTDDEKIKNQCHFYLAKIYEKARKEDLAEGQYKMISVEVPRISVKKIKKNWWFFNGYPGFQWDSNVALIADGVATPPDISGKQSARMFVALSGGIIPLQRDNIVLSAAYTYYHGFNLMNALSRYNFNLHTVSADMIVNKKINRRAYRFLMGYDYQLTLISNKFNFFSQSHIISPRFQLHWDKKWITEIRTSFSIDDYYASAFDEDNRDALLTTAGVIETMYFNARKSKAYLAFDIESNKADGYNFDFYGLVPSLGVSSPLWWFSEIKLDFSFAYRKFHNFLPPPRRVDKILTIQANIKKQITRWFEISINEAFAYDKSIANYSYKRNVVSLIFGFLL